MRVFPELLVDEEYLALGGTGSLNDRQFQFLLTRAPVNSITDMMDWWIDYGDEEESPPVTPRLLLHWIDGNLFMREVSV